MKKNFLTGGALSVDRLIEERAPTLLKTQCLEPLHLYYTERKQGLGLKQHQQGLAWLITGNWDENEVCWWR